MIKNYNRVRVLSFKLLVSGCKLQAPGDQQSTEYRVIFIAYFWTPCYLETVNDIP